MPRARRRARRARRAPRLRHAPHGARRPRAPCRRRRQPSSGRPEADARPRRAARRRRRPAQSSAAATLARSSGSASSASLAQSTKATAIGLRRSASSAVGAAAKTLRLRREVERRIVAQDRLLQGLELRARLDTELVDERQPRPPVGLERVRLTAGAIERQHQLLAERLAVRMLLDERLERRQERAMVAERQLGADQILLHRQPQLLELGDRRACGTVELETGEAVAAPERKRLAQARRGRLGVVAQHGLAALVDEALRTGLRRAGPQRAELRTRAPG